MWAAWLWWGMAGAFGMCWCRCTRRWASRGGRRTRWGGVEDELGGADYEAVAQAILDEFGARYELYGGALSAETLRLAEGLEGEHLAP